MGLAAPGSVIIPAHDEEGRIGDCLAVLAAGLPPGVAVVVVANGCTDATAERARAAAAGLGLDALVLDLPEPGKAGAIRAGERVAQQPRLYLDADTACPGTTAAALLRAVAGDAAGVAVPARALDLRGCTFLARAYHRTWSRLPWVREQLAGRGAYALGRAARDTFGEFPAVVADDRFATTRVPRERAIVVGEPAVVRPAPSLRELLAARTRIYAGNDALAHAPGIGVPAHDAAAPARALGLARLAADPRHWLGLGVFAAVALVAKARARSGAAPAWRASPVPPARVPARVPAMVPAAAGGES